MHKCDKMAHGNIITKMKCLLDRVPLRISNMFIMVFRIFKVIIWLPHEFTFKNVDDQQIK